MNIRYQTRMKKALIFVLCLLATLCVGLLVACEKPSNIPPTPPHEHTYSQTWSSNSVYHWHAATCEHNTLVADKAEHTFADGECTECGAHVSNVYEIYFYSHLIFVDGQELEEDHIYSASGECMVCGAKNHIHEYDQYTFYRFDLDLHGVSCECGVVDHYESHQFDGDICVKCNQPRHDHVWTFIDQYDETFHNAKCSDCNKIVSERHDCIGDTPCSLCGYFIHEHDWVVGDAASADEHWIVCSICSLASLQAHDFADGETCAMCGATQQVHAWVWDGESYANVHFLICADCGAMSWEEHQFAQGGERCLVCNAPIHVHHWQFTDSCSVMINYHQLYCEECGNEGWQEHMYNSANICVKCGYLEGSGEISSNNPSPTCAFFPFKRLVVEDVLKTWGEIFVV